MGQHGATARADSMLADESGAHTFEPASARPQGRLHVVMSPDEARSIYQDHPV